MRKLFAPLVAATLVLTIVGPASAVDDIDSTKLRQAVTVGGIIAHERVFQRIANQNDGTRASGTPGFDASAAYVKDTLKKAGYRVTEQTFTFPFFRELAPAELEQVAPTPTVYETGTFDFSGSGDITGQLVPTNDIVIPPTPAPSSTSGCEPTDFPPAWPEPQVALIQRGTCFFEDKAKNAQDAGYDAAIIFNEGQPGRDELFTGTLGSPVNIPVVGLSFADGAALYAQTQAGPVTVRVVTSTESELERHDREHHRRLPRAATRTRSWSSARTRLGRQAPASTTTAAAARRILEIAEEMAELKHQAAPESALRVLGRRGGGAARLRALCEQPQRRELAKIFANLNFDMLGSPNYVRFVYDGDGSDTPDAGTAGLGRDRADLQRLLRVPGPGDRADRRSTADRTTARSSTSASRPAACSVVPRASRPLRRPPCTAARPASRTTPATTRRATRSATSILNALFELGDAVAHAVLTLARTKTGFFPDGSLRQRQVARSAPVADYKGHSAIR